MWVKNTCFAAALLASGAAVAVEIPLNPAVTQTNIQSTICVRGWTATVRPPFSYTNRIKRRLVREAGLPRSAIHDFELDHVEPLDLAGAPYDPANLRLQPWPQAREKDRIEACLGAAVCGGAVSLAQAQQAMWVDWRTADRFCTVPTWGHGW